MLEQVATMLPPHLEVLLLADRGFVDDALIRWLQAQGWHWCVRLKRSSRIYRPRHDWCFVEALTPSVERALCLSWRRKRRWGHSLAVGLPFSARDPWYILSDEPTSLTTFAAYAQRIQIEASCLDDKSNAFRVESSYLQDPQALERLGLVLAAVTFSLVAQGVQVVATQTGGPHWFRGASSLKIGWRCVKRALFYHHPLLQRLWLLCDLSPERAKASRTQ
nr:transposase [Ardenticatena sp.]